MRARITELSTDYVSVDRPFVSICTNFTGLVCRSTVVHRPVRNAASGTIYAPVAGPLHRWVEAAGQVVAQREFPEALRQDVREQPSAGRLDLRRPRRDVLDAGEGNRERTVLI
jgi:hypothetical protein